MSLKKPPIFKKVIIKKKRRASWLADEKYSTSNLLRIIFIFKKFFGEKLKFSAKKWSKNVPTPFRSKIRPL
jgi:hypothetical protein